MDTPLSGQIFGHYRILDQLGAGGMGVVYRAQDQRLGRLVALKVLPPATAQDQEAVERFRREARTASSLSHPNICTIYSFEEIDDQLVLAMELLDGETLDRRLAGRPMDLRTLLDISEQVADALDAAHSEGILHRDVKPANIFITRRGQAKVLDFGLAKLAPDVRRGTQETRAAAHFSSMAGTTVGTIAYMSPEQARGEDLDQRTDLFSFGVVLYEMATGRQGFPGHTTAVIFDGILNREPAAPSTVNAAIPAELDRIISKALDKDRAMRYQTAADIRADLRRLRRDSGSRRIVLPVLDSDPDAATVVLPAGARTPAAAMRPEIAQAHVSPSPLPGPTPPPVSGRSRGLLALLAATVLVAGGGLAVFLLRSGDVSDTASAAAVSSEAAPASMDAPSPPASVDAPNAGPPSPTTPPVTAGAAEPSASSRPGPVASPTTTRTAAAPSDPRPPADSDGAASRAAAERLSIAKAKLASNLHVQALDDLRQIVLDYPGSRTAADAALLSADELTKLNRVDDAMAAHVEFAGRFPSDPRVAKSRLDLAALLLKTRRSNREASAREMLGTIARDFPRTLEAQTALQRKLQLETSTRQKEKDPVLGIEAPVALPTLRTLAEQFPDAPGTMQALFRLAEIYTDLHQYERAAQALTDLATRFPANPHDAWFRLGELYERQLKDGDRARAAYAQVPGSSSRYREAQRRANRR